MNDIDTQIHAKVIGIEWDETRCRICGWAIHQFESEGCTKGSCSQRPQPRFRADTTPPYSASIIGSWRVVEVMREKYGRHFLMMISADSGLTAASFYSGPHDETRATRVDEKAPVAICLAALAVLGIEVAEAQSL